MPTDDGSGLTITNASCQARPCCSPHHPEKPIDRTQWRPWPFPLQDSDLLAQRNDLESNITAGWEEDTDGGNQRPQKGNHRETLIILRHGCCPGMRL